MFQILAGGATGADTEDTRQPLAAFPQGQWSDGVRASLERPVKPAFASPEEPQDDYLWALSDAGRALLLEHTGASGVHNRFSVAPYDVKTFLEASPFEDGPDDNGQQGSRFHPGAGIPDEPTRQRRKQRKEAPAEVSAEPSPKHNTLPVSTAPVPQPTKTQPFTFLDKPIQKTRMMISAEADAAEKVQENEMALAKIFTAKKVPTVRKWVEVSRQGVGYGWEGGPAQLIPDQASEIEGCVKVRSLDGEEHDVRRERIKKRPTTVVPTASHSKLRARQQREVRYRRKREQMGLEISRCCKDGFQKLSAGEASAAVAAFQRGIKLQREWRALASRCGELVDKAAVVMRVAQVLEQEAGDKAQYDYYTEFLAIMADYRNSVNGATREWLQPKEEGAKISPKWPILEVQFLFKNLGVDLTQLLDPDPDDGGGGSAEHKPAHWAHSTAGKFSELFTQFPSAGYRVCAEEADSLAREQRLQQGLDASRAAVANTEGAAMLRKATVAQQKGRCAVALQALEAGVRAVKCAKISLQDADVLNALTRQCDEVCQQDSTVVRPCSECYDPVAAKGEEQGFDSSGQKIYSGDSRVKHETLRWQPRRDDAASGAAAANASGPLSLASGGTASAEGDSTFECIVCGRSFGTRVAHWACGRQACRVAACQDCMPPPDSVVKPVLPVAKLSKAQRKLLQMQARKDGQRDAERAQIDQDRMKSDSHYSHAVQTRARQLEEEQHRRKLKAGGGELTAFGRSVTSEEAERARAKVNEKLAADLADEMAREQALIRCNGRVSVTGLPPPWGGLNGAYRTEGTDNDSAGFPIWRQATPESGGGGGRRGQLSMIRASRPPFASHVYETVQFDPTTGKALETERNWWCVLCFDEADDSRGKIGMPIACAESVPGDIPLCQPKAWALRHDEGPLGGEGRPSEGLSVRPLGDPFELRYFQWCVRHSRATRAGTSSALVDLTHLKPGRVPTLAEPDVARLLQRVGQGGCSLLEFLDSAELKLVVVESSPTATTGALKRKALEEGVAAALKQRFAIAVAVGDIPSSRDLSEDERLFRSLKIKLCTRVEEARARAQKAAIAVMEARERAREAALALAEGAIAESDSQRIAEAVTRTEAAAAAALAAVVPKGQQALDMLPVLTRGQSERTCVVLTAREVMRGLVKPDTEQDRPRPAVGGRVSPLDVKRWLRQCATQDFHERLRAHDVAHAPGAPPEMKVLADTIADVYRLPETRWPYMGSRAMVERREYAPEDQPKIDFKPGLTPGQYRAEQEIAAFTAAAAEAASAATSMGVGAIAGRFGDEDAAIAAVAEEIRTVAAAAAETALASEMTKGGAASQRPPMP